MALFCAVPALPCPYMERLKLRKHTFLMYQHGGLEQGAKSVPHSP